MKQTANESNQVSVEQALDAQLGNLDELTRAKLTAARLNALEQSQSQSGWQKLLNMSWASKGIMASAFSVTFAVVLWLAPIGQNAVDEELLFQVMQNPVLTEDPEMLEQLEFIAWLEQEALIDGSGV